LAPTVALTGFMGSGKTTVGRRTARLLQWAFIDLDHEITSSSGSDIPSIFSTHGEDAFRSLELHALTKVLEGEVSQKGLVLALGGGTVTSSKARERLKGSAIVVYLEVDLDTAWRRVCSSDRPLARDRESFASLFAARQSLYESVADHTIAVAGRAQADVAREVADIARGLTGET